MSRASKLLLIVAGGAALLAPPAAPAQKQESAVRSQESENRQPAPLPLMLPPPTEAPEPAPPPRPASPLGVPLGGPGTVPAIPALPIHGPPVPPSVTLGPVDRVDPVRTTLPAGPPPAQPIGPIAHLMGRDPEAPNLTGDPLLDPPFLPPPGFVANVEFAVFTPRLDSQLTAPVLFSPTAGDVVHLPSGALTATVSPRFEFGYRFGAGAGEMLFGYRWLGSTGSRSFFDPAFSPGPGDLRTHLDIHQIDAEYASNEYALGPKWGMRWEVGSRLQTTFFDETGTGLGIQQRQSSGFVGGGFTTALGLRWELGGGISVFNRFGYALIYGNNTQAFTEVTVNPDGTVSAGQTNFTQKAAIAEIDEKFGLSWEPPGWKRTHIDLGYQFDRMYNISRYSPTTSVANLTLSGVFARIDLNF